MITIPSLDILYNSILSNLKRALNIRYTIGRQVVNAFSLVQAGKIKLMYQVAKAVNDNVYPDTCDFDTLKRFGAIKLGRLPFSAGIGEYSIVISGTSGTVVPSFTAFISTGDATVVGIVLETTTAVTIGSTGSVVAVARATTGGLATLLRGQEGMDLGDPLRIQFPLTGVSALANVSTVINSPYDQESESAYRIAVLESFRYLPPYGNRSGYILWAKSVDGVKGAYPYVDTNQAGRIILYIESFDVTTNYVAPQSLLDAVYAYINPSRFLLTVLNLAVQSVLPLSVEVRISSTTNLERFRAELTQELSNYLEFIRPFIDGVDVIGSVNPTLRSSDLYPVVTRVIGGIGIAEITILVDGTDYGDSYKFTTNMIPYLGTLTLIDL